MGQKRGDDEISSLESQRRGRPLVYHLFRLDQRSCALFGMDGRGMKAAGHYEVVQEHVTPHRLQQHPHDYR